MISSRLVIPREDHLDQMNSMISYPMKYFNTELVFDSSDPVVDSSILEQKCCVSSEFGHVFKEGG